MPWMRVLSCAVAQVSEEEYKLTLVLGSNSIPSDPVPATFPASGRLYQPTNKDGVSSLNPSVRYDSTGDDPAPGLLPAALQGSLEYVIDNSTVHEFTGFRALGSGSLNVRFQADDIGFETSCIPVITVNGVIVASSPHTAAGFHSLSWNFDVDIDVSPGDVIATGFTATGGLGGVPTIPAGTGDPSNGLFVEGDLTPP